MAAAFSTREYPSRDCAVCGCNGKMLLYRQRFSKLSSGSLVTGYDVVFCTSCGFAFADRLPVQDDFDQYYREMSKYEYHDSGGKESSYDVARFQQLRDLLLPHLGSSGDRIVDVGCATGKFISLLSDSGYRDVTGLDPSPCCARAAKELYGVRVLTGSVADLPGFGEIFDCVILSGVLEHLLDPKWVLTMLRERMSEQGIICIEVPDASRFADWDDAPYQQFSVEHINFFTSLSLRNLVLAAGFAEVVCVEGAHAMSLTTTMPVVTSIFRKSADPEGSLSYDLVAEPGLREYLRRSAQVEDSIKQTIRSIVEKGNPIMIWGAGTHTLHLLESTDLAQTKISAVIDANISYQGKRLQGAPILAPEAIKARPEPILVSSRVFQEEIVRKIRDDGLSNEIITLYDLGALSDPDKGAA